MEQSRPFYRVKDLADLLDCTHEEVIALAESGKIKETKEGFYWKFRIADVMEYMEEQRKR